MPASPITELFRNLLGAPSGPVLPGVGARVASRHRSPEQDFAGRLAETLRTRPKPKPQPPSDPRFDSQPEPSEKIPPEPKPRNDKPERATPEDRSQNQAGGEPAAEPLPSESPAGPTRTAEGSPDPAPTDQPSTKQEPTANREQPQPQGQTPPQAQVQGQARSAGAAPTNTGLPAAMQAGLSAALQAIFSTNSNFSANSNATTGVSAETPATDQAVRTDVGQQSGHQPGGRSAGQGGPQTARQEPSSLPPQNLTGTFDALKAILNGTTDARESSPARPAAPPKTPSPAAAGKTPDAGEAVQRPASQETPPRPAPTLVQPQADAQPQTKPSTPFAGVVNQPCEPANPVLQATVIPNDPHGQPVAREGASARPVVGDQQTNVPGSQPPSGDSALALNLARLLLNVKVVRAGSDPAFQPEVQSQAARTTDAQRPAGKSGPAPQGPAGLAPTGGSTETGGSAGRADLTGQPGMKFSTFSARAGRSGNEPSPVEQVVRAARAHMGVRHSQVRLQLEPPDLGQLRIDVRVSGKAVQMQVEAQTQVAHQLLTSRVSELRGALEAQGLSVERVQIDLKSPQQGSSSQNHQDHSGLDHPMGDAHPEARWGGQGQAESGPKQGEPEETADGPCGEPGEEDRAPEMVARWRVNLMA